MIPNAQPNGELPPGEHLATLDEIEARYATNRVRRDQFDGLAEACHGLAAAGCATLWLDGSYITTKPEPGDFDAAIDVDGIDWITLGLDHPELMDFDPPRTTQKRRYGGEFIRVVPGVTTIVEFFQRNRNGEPKGIIRIDLTQLT